MGRFDAGRRGVRPVLLVNLPWTSPDKTKAEKLRKMSKKELTSPCINDIILKLSQLQRNNETWGQEKRVDKRITRWYNIQAIKIEAKVHFINK